MARKLPEAATAVDDQAPSRAFLALVNRVRKDVDDRLATFLAEREAEDAPRGPEVGHMIGALRDLVLRGGKRLRAALVFVGLAAAGVELDAASPATADGPAKLVDSARDAGVALELLQSYFLVHDDWMDGDDVRRGGPAVHAALRRALRDRRLGDAAGILAGDYLVALATEALADAHIPPDRASAVFRAFADMQRAAVVGQQLDLVARARDPEITYELKTASYSVRGPLRLGALLGGAPTAVLEALDRYALPVGVAFQLRDDLIGAFGDEAETGKPQGNDLRAGKRTPLVLRGLAAARGTDREALRRAFANPRATARQVQRALEVLERSGARAVVERRIELLVSEAVAVVHGADLPPGARQLLLGASAALTARRS